MSNPKKEQILRTGKELFWKYGIRRVTIEEICKMAGVSKMTYYKFFTNKMDLVKSILNNMLETAMSEYQSIMDSDIPFTEKVSLSIKLKMDNTKSMSNEFYHDYVSHADPEMISFLEDMTEKNLKLVMDSYRKAQEEGDIRKDLRLEFILYFFNQMFVMLQDDSLLEIYGNPQDLVHELVRFFFYGIVEREDH